MKCMQCHQMRRALVNEGEKFSASESLRLRLQGSRSIDGSTISRIILLNPFVLGK